MRSLAFNETCTLQVATEYLLFRKALPRSEPLFVFAYFSRGQAAAKRNKTRLFLFLFFSLAERAENRAVVVPIRSFANRHQERIYVWSSNMSPREIISLEQLEEARGDLCIKLESNGREQDLWSREVCPVCVGWSLESLLHAFRCHLLRVTVKCHSVRYRRYLDDPKRERNMEEDADVIALRNLPPRKMSRGRGTDVFGNVRPQMDDRCLGANRARNSRFEASQRETVAEKNPAGGRRGDGDGTARGRDCSIANRHAHKDARG